MHWFFLYWHKIICTINTEVGDNWTLNFPSPSLTHTHTHTHTQIVIRGQIGTVSWANEHSTTAVWSQHGYATRSSCIQSMSGPSCCSAEWKCQWSPNSAIQMQLVYTVSSPRWWQIYRSMLKWVGCNGSSMWINDVRLVQLMKIVETITPNFKLRSCVTKLVMLNFWNLHEKHSYAVISDP